MKNLILYFLSFILVMFSSCATESLLDENPNGDNVTVTIKLPTEIRTRAFSDGSTFDIIKCYIYDSSIEDKDAPVRTETVAIREESGFRGGTLSLDLPSGKEYQMVFLATAGSVDSPDGKLYYNPTERTINVDYSKTATNDESLDCFFGVLPEVNKFTATYTVTLKRPYAQLNIGASDLADYNELASAPLETVGVSVDGVYSSMNVMDGSVAGEPMKAVVAASTMPEEETFPVPDNDYLSMNYLIVDSRKNVAVTMTASNGVNTFNTDFADIPLQRNYQTNIYGKLLTTNSDFKVEINPIFAGANNGNVDDPYPDYDLVLQLTDDWNRNNPTYIFPHVFSSTKVFYINNYVDSSNLLKLKWSDIGYSFFTLAFCRNYDYTKSEDLSRYIKIAFKVNVNEFDENNFQIQVSKLFSNCSRMTECPAIYLWDFYKIKSLYRLFYNCSSLKSLDLSDIDFCNVSDFTETFKNCQSLSELQLPDFSKIKNISGISGMFYNCRSLKNLDLSNINTSRVQDMSEIFNSCHSLEHLDVSNFDTSQVNNMRSMFAYCESLESLDVSNFNTSNVTNMADMFSNCKSLTSIDLSKFDTSNVIYISDMFAYCESLESLDVSNFDTSNVITMAGMFNCCTKLQNLNISNFDTSNVGYMNSMFNACTSLSYLDVSNLNTSNVITMSDMFNGCSSLSNLDVSNFNTSNVIYMTGMFSGCSSLTNIDLLKLDTSSVEDMSQMFMNCSKLQNLNLSNFDTRKVKNMGYMFYYCLNLTSVDLSSFETTSVTNMNGMFGFCMNLKNIDVSNFNTSNVTNMAGMFSHCNTLEYLDISNFSMDKNPNVNNIIYNCNKLSIWEIPNIILEKPGDIFLFATSLRHIAGNISQIKNSFNMRNAYQLDNSSVVMLLNGLAPVETTQTITLSKSTYDTLTDEQKAIATAKNWKIEYVN